QALLLAELEVLLTATRRNVHNAGAGRGADIFPGDDAVRIFRRDFGRPVLAANDLRELLGEARYVLLGVELVERAVVSPADHLGAGDFADDFEAFFAFFLEELLDRLQTRRRGLLAVRAIDVDFDIILGRVFAGARRGEGGLADVVGVALVLHFDVG